MNITMHLLPETAASRCAVLALPAVLEFPELRQSTDYREDVHRVISSMTEFDRCEVVATVDGKVVGGAIIVADNDQHVGPCLSLQWQYVLPAYRGQQLGRRFVRELLRQAGWAGIRNVCYTHRVGVGKYTLTYREVKHGQEEQPIQEGAEQGDEGRHPGAG